MLITNVFREILLKYIVIVIRYIMSVLIVNWNFYKTSIFCLNVDFIVEILFVNEKTNVLLMTKVI